MPAFLQTNLSFVIVLIAGVAGALISYFMYRRTIPPVSRRLTIFLSLLRGIYTAAILVFLFKPEITLVWRNREPKQISILLDRSGSMGLGGEESRRIDQAELVYRELNRQLGGMAQLHPMAFDTDTLSLNEAPSDSLEAGTDIDRALTLAAKTTPAPDAIVLITDGNYSVGRNPLYREGIRDIPIFTIGIGDTAESADVQITEIETPKLVYQNRDLIIRINVMATGVDSANTELTLRSGEKIISRQNLLVGRDRQEQVVTFKTVPRYPGTYVYEVQASPVLNERNRKNNRAVAQVLVLKEKPGVALLTSKPDNDFKFMKLLLEMHEDLRVFPVVSVGGRRIGPALPADSVDVVIWNQIPGPQELSLLSPDLDLSAYPGLLIFSEKPDHQKMTFINNYLPLRTLGYLGREFLAQVRPAAGGERFAPVNVLESRELSLRFWQAAPPISYMFAEPQPPAGIEVILETSSPMHGTERGSPVMLTGQVRGKKSVLLLGGGFWRWHFMLAGHPQFNRTWDHIVYNLVRWLASSREAKNVQLEILDKDVKTGEILHLAANIYDGAFEPMDTATVRFQVSGPDGAFEVPAENSTGGRYEGTFIPASEGAYRIQTIAWLRDQYLGADSTVLQIMPVSQEYIATTQNVALLKRLSRESGGRYFPAAQSDSVASVLDLTPLIVKQTRTYQLWDRLPVLLFVLTLLSVEWFLRRRRGLA